MPNLGTKQKLGRGPSVIQHTSNIPELRPSILSLLSARYLLEVQRVCRSWYMTIASERKLHQRIILAAGPGELIVSARKGGKIPPALHPYNSNQRKALAMEQDLEACHGGTQLYLLPTATGGVSEELSATSVQQKTGTDIIMNPFLTPLAPAPGEHDSAPSPARLAAVAHRLLAPHAANLPTCHLS
ncbi:hypothetical protein MBLNU13_g04082t1 [Cladosporium sp. NU13]